MSEIKKFIDLELRNFKSNMDEPNDFFNVHDECFELGQLDILGKLCLAENYQLERFKLLKESYIIKMQN